MESARAAAGISKGWVAYGVVAAIALLAFALAPLYVTLPDDPPRRRRRPPPTQPPQPPVEGQVRDDL